MRKLLIYFLLGFLFQANAQVAPSKYLVKFTDKDQSPYSLTQPDEFLSQRAIDRRTKQGIAIDITDIPIDPVYIQGVSAVGAKVVIQVKWLNAIIIETELQSVLDAVIDLSYVADIGIIEKRIPDFNTVDKFASEEIATLKVSNLDPVYGDAFNQIDMVNGIPLHESGYKGDGLVIAILDAGFVNVDVRTIFQSLWDNNQILGCYNFVDPTTDVYDFHYHGTMVLSVMGGNIPGIYLGTAPEASFWLLLTEDDRSEFIIEEYNWIAGAAFADSVGADIINSSLGYSVFDNTIYDHAWTDLDGNTTPITKAADLAASKGILVVNSAGNEGDDIWKYITAPSDGDSVLTIGAVYGNELITSFSSYGFDWDPRVKPNIVAQGGSTVLADAFSDGIVTGNGTSFSSPLIAGMMACLWQAIPTANNIELIQAVEQSASKYSNPDNRYGYGIPDFSSAQIILNLSENLSLDNSIQVIPNPISNSAIIRWDQSKITFEWLELIDLHGRVLLSDNIENTIGQYQISLRNFPKGIYFLRLGDQNQYQTKKIIKID